MTGIILELFGKLNRGEPFKSISGPLLPNLSRGDHIDITITRDVKGKKTKSKNSTWITIKRIIPPISPPSPITSNMSTNNDRNGEENPSDGGDGISTTDKVSPPEDLKIHAQFCKSEGSEDGRDTFRCIYQRCTKFQLTIADLSVCVSSNKMKFH